LSRTRSDRCVVIPSFPPWINEPKTESKRSSLQPDWGAPAPLHRSNFKSSWSPPLSSRNPPPNKRSLSLVDLLLHSEDRPRNGSSIMHAPTPHNHAAAKPQTARGTQAKPAANVSMDRVVVEFIRFCVVVSCQELLWDRT